MQARLAQGNAANGSGTPEVERTNSSKVPWLVVRPDGVELAIAHKVRLAPSSNDTDHKMAKATLVRLHMCVYSSRHHCASQLVVSSNVTLQCKSLASLHVQAASWSCKHGTQVNPVGNPPAAVPLFGCGHTGCQGQGSCNAQHNHHDNRLVSKHASSPDSPA